MENRAKLQARDKNNQKWVDEKTLNQKGLVSGGLNKIFVKYKDKNKELKVSLNIYQGSLSVKKLKELSIGKTTPAYLKSLAYNTLGDDDIFTKKELKELKDNEERIKKAFAQIGVN
jgi:hypothetical protein